MKHLKAICVSLCLLMLAGNLAGCDIGGIFISAAADCEHDEVWRVGTSSCEPAP